MSGSKLTSVCPTCKTENQIRGKAFTIALTCSKCQLYFNRGSWKSEVVNFNAVYEPVIPIGTKGKIENVPYEVMGFVVKQEKIHKYKWREYLLFNPFKGFAFLSEYDGHWNFIWPIEEPPKSDSGSEFSYEEKHFRIYQRYSAQVVYAKGEFFFDVVDITDSTETSEYIAPPFLFGIEKSEDSVISYLGEYIAQKDVAKAFNVSSDKLPGRGGVGYTQPASTSFSDRGLLIMTAILMGLVLLIQLVFDTGSMKKQVFAGSFTQDQLGDQKFFKTPTFELEGSSKSLEIDISAPLDNNWFFAEFSLINEADGHEYFFTKDIEYYHGYESGESWTEGSTEGDAFLSSIPAGKYHISIFPQYNNTGHEIYLRVIRDVATYSNFWITWIILAIFPIWFYIRKRFIEAKRWENSDYSPYHNNEE